MPVNLSIRFVPLAQISAPKKPARGAKGDAASTVLAVFAGKDGALSPATSKLLGGAADAVARAAKATKFKGFAGSTLDLLAPQDLAFDRLLVLGTARKDEKELPPQPADALAGGALMAKLSGPCNVSVLFDPPQGARAQEGAALAAGMRLRSYKFETYKTKKKDDEKDGDNGKGKPEGVIDVTIGVADPAAVKKAAVAQDAIVEGVIVARDLVNEPANVLTPVEFARRAAELKSLGVQIDVLDVKAMQKLGMNTLLGVGQGSINESRLVVMRWNGGGKAQPVSFIGKGVTFDTGGISIKPAGGMEDMKGDMAGAACVTGLMRTFALRKAKANIIGAIGLVENMPGHNAQRPGDIVKSMSGQTVEVINTDAEGRLVLADVLWYIQDKYKPQFMVNLATLTGAILVALGNEHAGLFSNNDELAQRLTETGKATGEKVWRMPLSLRLRQDAGLQVRRHEERRRPSCRLHHGSAVPATLRQQDALGASRYRRHRHGLAAKRHQPELGLGLGRKTARQARRRPLREVTNSVSGVSMRHLLFAALAAAGLALPAGQAAAQASSCEGFMAHMQKSLPDLDPKFVRPVVVSRGAGPQGDVRDMIVKLRIDGQITCDGDRFMRFEARIHEPSSSQLRDAFFRVQQSAAMFKLRWSAAHAARVIQAMTAEAADYLRGSAEREDHVVAGKVEHHAGEAGDLGLIWTKSDRTFIVVEYTP